MSKALRIAGAAAVLGIATVGAGPAWADHMRKTAAPCVPSGTSLALSAELHKFDKDCLAVTAGESFTIRFDNKDSDRHNVAILPSHESTEPMFSGDIIPGPKITLYAVPSLKAGTYHFHCEVHPNLMNGTFVVAAAPGADGQAAPTPPPMTKDPGPPAAAPTTSAAPAPAPARAAESAKAAPAAKASPATTATTRGAQAAPATAAAPAPAPAPAPAGAPAEPLARTGGPDRTLVLLAGVALAGGGLAVLGGARARGGA